MSETRSIRNISRQPHCTVAPHCGAALGATRHTVALHCVAASDYTAEPHKRLSLCEVHAVANCFPLAKLPKHSKDLVDEKGADSWTTKGGGAHYQ